MIKIFLLILAFQVSAKNKAAVYTEQSTNDSIEVNKLFELYNDTYSTDTAKSREYLLKAFYLSNTINYNKGKAISAMKLGEYYLDRLNLVMAGEYYNIALKYYKSTGNKSEEAKITNNLGVISEKAGNYSNSLAYYLNAFELYDSLENFKGISATANNLGIIYYLMNYPQKAKRFYLLSLNIKKQAKDTLALIFTYQNLGNVYAELWQYDSSLYNYNQSLNLSVKINDEKSTAKVLNSMGNLNLIKGNHEMAMLIFNQALVLARKNQDYQNISSLYDNLGTLNYSKRKNELAINYFDSSLAIAEKFGLKEEMKTAYQHLADVYANEKLYKEAFLNMQSYENVKTGLSSEKSDAAGVEAIFVKQKQENKILKLEKEKEKRKALLIILGFIIAIVLITAILLSYIDRMRQKSILERTLAEQEKLRFKAVLEAQEMERKRIAGDLHDSVGQMLSLSKLHLSEIADVLSDELSENKYILNDSMRIIDEACQEVRKISHNLMPGALIRLGLTAAIKDLIRKVGSSKIVKVSFTDEFGDERLEEKVEISIYRIIQEIFSNIIKHAKASEVAITLIKKPANTMQLLITDNGIGFNTEIINTSNGIGWINIYSRLAIINGRMDVISHKNTGTKIDIRINL